MFFNVAEEMHNLVSEFPDKADELRGALNTLPDVVYLLERQKQHDKFAEWMCTVEEASGAGEDERWQILS